MTDALREAVKAANPQSDSDPVTLPDGRTLPFGSIVSMTNGEALDWVRNQARRPGAESQALALVINAHPEWTKEIRDNRMTAAGWAALPKAIQDEAEFAYESFFGMPMPDEDTAASPPTELGAQDGT